ncbi:hypothetical protein DERP_000124 [Dermatophagoides pteronyssinus]|uniref:Uncharacterized protein n=1 Tax=Dermatophagoides pteronyssinus TaxID=6956 RepID=A0ABQ8IZW8_DERPT|nr:hypothetical protein DERP_000124 [Dermatophagoides pteronyssinus]
MNENVFFLYEDYKDSIVTSKEMFQSNTSCEFKIFSLKNLKNEQIKCEAKNKNSNDKCFVSEIPEYLSNILISFHDIFATDKLIAFLHHFSIRLYRHQHCVIVSWLVVEVLIRFLFLSFSHKLE